MFIFLQFLLEAGGEKHQEIEVVRALNNLKGNGKATQFHISSFRQKEIFGFKYYLLKNIYTVDLTIYQLMPIVCFR